jgi:SNF2 family DNA or RNA helicase
VTQPAPWPHQTDLVDFTVKHRKVAGMHDTGIGKSRSAVMTADRIKAKRVLVLCPAMATGVWRDQFHLWGQEPRTVAIIRNATSDLLADVVIVSFDLLSTKPRLAKRLVQYNFDLVIIDEAHALKTADSKRTIAAYGEDTKTGGVAHTAPYVLLLTATLMPNHPAELWPHLHALRPELITGVLGRDSFVDRYCVTKTEWRGSTPIERIKGSQRGAPAQDLRRRLTTFIHRVRKQDVLKDLPPVLVTTVPVHIADLILSPDLVNEWRLAEAALMRDIGTATGEDALAIARSSPHSATQRRLTGIIKSHAMVEALREELQSGDHKIISFAYHKSVLDIIDAGLFGYGVVTLDGRTPKPKREHLIWEFQTSAHKRLFNGQISLSSESIDLTAASSLWVMESDWSPRTITQAIGRAHRHGQRSSVNVKFLALEGSIDLALSRTLARKASEISEILDPLDA